MENQPTIFDFETAQADNSIVTRIKDILSEIEDLELDDKVATLNALKVAMHDVSPFKEEPVDLVLWVKNTEIGANDYNPNSVAPPEMELLRTSILNDGYTQPIVSWNREDHYEVVDGFHRSRVGKEYDEVRTRVNGYLPITVIKDSQTGRGDRMASTIRHNRARGKHSVESMSEIVLELKRRNWTDKKISKELGMDADEVLRLTQIQGLAEMFKDEEFTEAWEVDVDQIREEEVTTFEVIDDEE